MGETEAKNENLHGDELREKKRHQIAKSERDAVDRILDQSLSRLVTGDVPEPVPERLVALSSRQPVPESRGTHYVSVTITW